MTEMNEFNIDLFTKKPKKYLDTLSVQSIVDFLDKANYYYRNTETTLVSDDVYDYILDYLKKKDPKNPFLVTIGAPVERKVKLPIWMGSQDKIREDPKTLERWLLKYNPPYVLTDKLDGNSGLFVYDKNKKITLYTRGDGAYGQNVTGVLNFITKKSWNFEHAPIMVRGEFIISKDNWEKIKHRGANARNVAAGVLNSKTIDPSIAKYLDFVAYELLEPKLEFQEGLEFMKGNGFNVVEYDIVDKEMMTMDYLSNYLIRRRKESVYDIDGIVARDNEHHPVVTGKNPKYSFAFKSILTHEEAEVMVSHVEWNVSKHGLIKPLVHFNAVNIGGVKIQKATGFNAAFIQQHKIGLGSKIVIIRSGDVIPHIVRILSESSNGMPSMPDIPYEWNESGVDIMVSKDQDNDQMKIRQLENFVNVLDIQFIGSGVVKKLYENGINTIPKFIAIQKKDLLALEGVQEKGAEKMIKSIQARMKTVTCEELMAASNLFGRGFGLKKLQVIINEHPEILKQEPIKVLKPIKGVGDITANQFLLELPKFYKFLKDIGFKCSVKKKVSKDTVVDKIFEGKSIVFTGFRNKEWEKKIEEMGGKISSSISKNTFLVITVNTNEETQKILKAKELGILISKDEFSKKYNFAI